MRLKPTLRSHLVFMEVVLAELEMKSVYVGMILSFCLDGSNLTGLRVNMILSDVSS